MNKQPLLDIMKDDIDRIVNENVKQVREEADARLKKTSANQIKNNEYLWGAY